MPRLNYLPERLKRVLLAGVVASLSWTGQAQSTPPVIYSYNATGGYAPNGNLVSYADSVNGTWNLGYDGLNRLTDGSVTASGSQTPAFLCWSYDSFGNRLTQAGSPSTFGGTPGTDCRTRATGALTANAWVHYDANNHATASSLSVTPNSLLPDAAGNMTTDGQNSFLYDGEGRLCAARTSVGMTGYLYNAEGQRVATGSLSAFSCDVTTNGFTVRKEYLLGLSGEQVTELAGDGTWNHTNVYAGGQLLATYDPQGLHFNLSDPLGTKRVQVSGTGAIENSWSSQPFGDGLMSLGSGEDATEHHFTGKERDTESGLDYFGARYYGSSMGRFMSPDPSGLMYADATNPQSLNLYSYVLNNPLRMVDLSGLTPCDYGPSDYGGDDILDAYSNADCQANGGTPYSVGETVNVNADGSSGFSLYSVQGGTSTLIQTGQSTAPNNTTSTKHLACAADVAINYAAGFIPGYNAAKFVLTAAGVNFNFVQNLTSGSSFVTGGPTAFNSLAALGSAYQGITLQAFKNAGGVALSNLPQAGIITDLGNVAKTAGTIGNVLNTVSAGYDLYNCYQKQ